MKQIILIVIIILGIGAFLKFGLKTSLKVSNTNTTAPISNPDLIIYYGNTCPHCKKVEDYISQNDINSKLKIDLKEVYQNKDNQLELQENAAKCEPKIDLASGIGVPFAFVKFNNQCLIGDQPVIDWIKNKVATSPAVIK
jgi:glutaredoxin